MGKEQFLTAIIDIKQYLSLTEHLFISVYLYGSVTRLEAIENISDIDLLFLYEKNLDRRHIDFLINLKKKIKIKYGIPLHTRLRLVDDLVTGRSGLMDCGFTSSINKLRDGKYSGNVYDYLRSQGFCYFIGQESTSRAWGQITETYMRQTRRPMAPNIMYYSYTYFDDVFNGQAVLDEARGEIPY